MNERATLSVDPAEHPPIAFPAADWTWLRERCAELGIAGVDERRERLEALYGHLCGVNQRLNLTRLTAPRDYLKYHVLDSLSLLLDRRLRRCSEGDPCVDLGAGGGYPGLVLALWQERIPWVLVDSRQRKVDFLVAACGLLPGSRVSARCFRGREVAAAAPDLRRRCQLVVSRAAGAVDKLLAESADILQRHGHLVVPKGPNYSDEEHASAERAAERLGYRFVTVAALQLEAGDPERLLVVFERSQ